MGKNDIIQIKVIRAEELRKPDSWNITQIDPFIEVRYGGQTVSTKPKTNTTSPAFNESLTLLSPEGRDAPDMQYLVFRMMDGNQVKHLDDPMSEGRVATKTLIRGPLSVKLAGADQSYAGTLYVDIENDGTDMLRFKTPELALISEICKSHPENLMARHFSDHYYFSLTQQKREQLLLCCKSGYENPNSKVGVYAMRPEDYDDFMPYFDKVLRDHFHIQGKLRHTNSWDLSKVKGLPKNKQLDLGALGVDCACIRVQVDRNLKGFPLPGGMSADDHLQLERIMLTALRKLMANPAFKGSYYTLTPGTDNTMTPEAHAKLVAEGLMFDDPARDSPELASAGMASHWPLGQGVYVSGDQGCAVRVGYLDHFSIVVRRADTLLLNEVFDRVYECLGIVAAEIDAQDFAPVKGQDSFAVSPCYGYVTSSPASLGSGMKASVELELPALTRGGADVGAAEQAAISEGVDLGFSVNGVIVNKLDVRALDAAGTVEVSPASRLCVQECEIMGALYKGIRLLRQREKEAELANRLSDRAAEWKRLDDACEAGYTVCEHCLEKLRIENLEGHVRRCSQKTSDPDKEIDESSKCKMPKPVSECTIQ